MKYGNITPLTSSYLRQSFRQTATDMTMITAGVVPGTDASSPAPGGSSGSGGAADGAGNSRPMQRERSLSGEMGKLCVYTGDAV